MSSGTALILTPSTQGIGKAIALPLADDGFDVAVNDIPGNDEKLSTVVDEIKAKGRKSSAHIADVSVESEVKAMVEEVVRVHGGLDVMATNAGVCKLMVETRRSGPIEVSVDNWGPTHGRQLPWSLSLLQVHRNADDQPGRGGGIIGASSVAGKRNSPLLTVAAILRLNRLLPQAGNSFMDAYAASKFAIRPDAGCCIGVRTPWNHMHLDPSYANLKITGNAQTQSSSDSGSFQKVATVAGLRNEINGFSTLMDIANLVSFIASKESQFVTGVSLRVLLRALNIDADSGYRPKRELD
ncbi:hypothetical protein C8R44DRAFT_748291 [Mycena epipterygia]|nr:hypothetical protein C8R44DRAFT_748291 [Mycena epipterygia]